MKHINLCHTKGNKDSLICSERNTRPLVGPMTFMGLEIPETT